MLKFADRSINEEFEYPAYPGTDDSPSLLSLSTIAQNVLAEVMQFRRFSGPKADCIDPICSKCLAPHLSKVISAVALGLPVTFVLPAFPGKSPNLNKVLGPLPDMAEKRALAFLQQLCDRIQRYYSPGARVILCSDGRVFSDVIGIRDEDVTTYQDELSRIITESGLHSLSTFNLDELYNGMSFEEMRIQLMDQHGDATEALRSAVSRGKGEDSSMDDKETHRLYCGITRFLVEDATFPGQKQSRTTLQKNCRIRAYQVIQRSKAWGDLVEIRFPNAVRLSIHPQTCGDKKLGIRLIEQDHWMTPWHGVAVKVGDRFILLKRTLAEELGGQLVYQDGRPSHYVLTNEKGLSKLQDASHGT